MKAKYIVLGLLMSTTLSLNARIFEAGERLYINMEAQSVKDAGGNLQYGWYSTTNNYNYAYFFNNTTSTNAWSGQVKQYSGTCWYVEAPAGDWEYVILTRHNAANPSWSTKITQTGNISFYYMDGGQKKMRDQNYIANFYYGSLHEEAGWEYVAPAPTGDPANWTLTCEDEQICTDAAGTSYMLQAKNYDYDNTYAHAWFKYENGSWTRIQGNEWRTEEGDKAFDVTLGDANSDVYYFLQCSRPSMCRLIRIRPNQNCAEGAPGACKITSFAAVSSDANVTDQTCAVDGLVAFDDKLNAGDLMIWCDNIDTVTILNADLKTPQTFKLKGLDASVAKNYTLHAKFLSGTSECEATCVVTVNPPAAPITTHTSTETPGDMRLTRFTEEDVTLTPFNQTSTYFQWTNSADDSIITGAFPDERNLTFTAPAEQTTIEYVFLGTNDPPSPEGNLITNGTFEDPLLDDKLESNYDAWGRGNTAYYSSHANASGGYAITDNATTFWHEYQSVSAHEGAYFGLFDSKIYDGTDQAAWIARSGTKNPKLKVDAGVSYLFSFWVANINAYYQMDNGARLQFQISYDNGSTWNDLGSEINLGNFKDVRWHGMSSIATPTVSSTTVVLRVINKNTSARNIGNDFALDDIRFEAITANSSNIAAFERFPVTYLKCEITSATFEQRQPVGCGTTVADVDYTVNFIHPRGDLYIYEGTTLLARIPHSTIGDETTSYTGVLANQPVDNADHVLTIYFDDTHVQTNAPTTYTYNAKAVPAISVASTAWTTLPGCDETTATLTAVINYTNQNGTLTANVDGGASVTQTYTIESDDEKQVTLVIPGVQADGQTGHTFNVTFDGSHGCSIVDYAIPIAAPVVPTIDTAQIAFNALSCTDLTTTLTFNLDYTYQQGTMTYWVDALPTQTTTYSVADLTKQTLTGLTVANIPADGKSNHVLHVSFDGTNSCIKSYTLPAVPFSPVINSVVISSVPTTVICPAQDYEITVTVTTPYDATGRNIVLSFDDNGAKDTTVVATGTSTVVKLPLHTIGGVAQAISAAYEATPACTKTSDEFTPPVRVACNKYIEEICDGDSYVKNGFNIVTPPVGTDTFTSGYDSLILTVHSIPAITIAPMAMTCDDEANILMPFTVVSGEPDSYDIVINGNHYAGTVSGTDISFTRTTELEAGDYSATITVGKTGIDCTSQVNVNFTIALGGSLLSKWTDVLFVNNASGRFVSYQWYKNGTEMSGETLQRLYDPTGLSGTTDEYMCRMTTTDGKTIYTCPQTFDSVTPSRTLNTDTESQIIGIYDTMGRPVSGHLGKGIYIVVTEENGERTSKKLFVYE